MSLTLIGWHGDGEGVIFELSSPDSGVEDDRPQQAGIDGSVGAALVGENHLQVHRLTQLHLQRGTNTRGVNLFRQQLAVRLVGFRGLADSAAGLLA